MKRLVQDYVCGHTILVCLQVTDAVGMSRIRSLNHEHGLKYLFAHV